MVSPAVRIAVRAGVDRTADGARADAQPHPAAADTQIGGVVQGVHRLADTPGDSQVNGVANRRAVDRDDLDVAATLDESGGFGVGGARVVEGMARCRLRPFSEAAQVLDQRAPIARRVALSEHARHPRATPAPRPATFPVTVVSLSSWLRSTPRTSAPVHPDRGCTSMSTRSVTVTVTVSLGAVCYLNPLIVDVVYRYYRQGQV